MRWMAGVWAGPATVVGWLLSFTFESRSRSDGVLIAEGARWPRRFGWRYRAITLGRVVLCVDQVDDGLMRHERVHVDQWERWGPLLLVAYPIASLVAVARGGHFYRDNAFEAAARRGLDDRVA